MDRRMLTPVNFHLFLNGIRIRVYFVSSIFHGYYRPHMLHHLRSHRPLSYPYIWYVYGGDQLAIVNIDDLQAYEQSQIHHHIHDQRSSSPSSSYEYYSETIIDDVAIRILQESFEQASDEFVACSGLTKKEISENLKITEYYLQEEEESEVCVICQVEYEKNEEVGVIQCGHRFHPECIQEWLLFKNVCPLCKHQALN